MIESVLVATDGSEASSAAERFAIALASRLHLRLRGVTVIEEHLIQGMHVPGLGVAPPPLDGLEGYLKARADAIVRRLGERARAAQVEIQCEVLSGRADDRIVEASKGVDLLVLGRDGQHAAFRTGLPGSTVDAVLRKVSRPVITVPSGAELGGGLLLAFDGSPGSVLAGQLAVELGTRLHENVSVFVDSKDKGRAAARFEEVRRLLGPLASPGRETSSTLGRPDVKIVEAARLAHSGLIVMGAHARNRITEYFLGSNAAAVVRTSPVAVLLAR